MWGNKLHANLHWWNMLRLSDKLLEVYREHGKIIIGVDFDDTIFPYTKYANRELINSVVNLLVKVKGKAYICLYTVSDNQSLKYKVEIMRLNKIEPDYINISPIKMGNGQKPFFNILLDDKAGLNEAYKELLRFKQTS